MSRNGTTAHIVVTSRAVHIQGREITPRRHGGVLTWGRGGAHGGMVREHSLAGATAFLVLTQVGFSLSGSFLDRPSVVVLVSGQRGTSGECLLTVRVWAFVGSLPGVDTAMSGK